MGCGFGVREVLFALVGGLTHVGNRREVLTSIRAVETVALILGLGLAAVAAFWHMPAPKPLGKLQARLHRIICARMMLRQISAPSRVRIVCTHMPEARFHSFACILRMYIMFQSHRIHTMLGIMCLLCCGFSLIGFGPRCLGFGFGPRCLQQRNGTIDREWLQIRP